MKEVIGICGTCKGWGDLEGATCPSCLGEKEVKGIPCQKCNGTGNRIISIGSKYAPRCVSCNGSGVQPSCKRCGGEGTYTSVADGNMYSCSDCKEI